MQRPTAGFWSTFLCVSLVTSSLYSRGTRDKDKGSSDKSSCLAAYDKAQQLRKTGKLSQAREQLALCARETCPSAAKQDCAQWLAEVDASLASILIDARDASGNDVAAVEVSVDGKLLTSKLENRPLNVDPGTHNIRFEMADADPIEQEVTLRKGEKDHRIQVLFRRPGEGARTVEPAGVIPKKKTALDENEKPNDAIKNSTVAAGPPDDNSQRAGAPALAYVFGGLGLVGVGGFAFLAVTGKSTEQDLKTTCSPRCKEADATAVQQRYLAADIALGVGLVSLGISTYLLVRPRGGAVEKAPAASKNKSVSFHVVPNVHGGSLNLQGQF